MNAKRIKGIIQERRRFYHWLESQGGDKILVDMAKERKAALDEVLLAINSKNTPLQSDPCDEDESI